MGKPRVQKREADAALEREAEAHRLSVRGFSERAIADQLGVSKTAVHKYLTAGRARFLASIQASQEERCADRHAALLAILESAWAHYKASGDLAALELVRKCESDIRRLYGDDAPVRSQTELSGKEGQVVFADKDTLIAEIRAAAKQGGAA